MHNVAATYSHRSPSTYTRGLIVDFSDDLHTVGATYSHRSLSTYTRGLIVDFRDNLHTVAATFTLFTFCLLIPGSNLSFKIEWNGIPWNLHASEDRHRFDCLRQNPGGNILSYLFIEYISVGPGFFRFQP